MTLATTAYKTPATIAVQTKRVTNLSDLDAGIFGIPENLLSGESVSPYVDSIILEDGVITATATSTLEDAVYQLQATITAHGAVRWTLDSSVANACQAKGLC